MRKEDLFYYGNYERADGMMGDCFAQRELYFEKLVNDTLDKKCLQVGVRDRKYAPHWVSVDKYDNAPYVDFHYDIHDLSAIPDETYDVVAAKAILEHVEDPWKAKSELTRILKKDGLIWIEIPFNQPYHPSPQDYWRVTPAGMRLLMAGFEEILCGTFRIRDSFIYNGVVFYGKKL